MKLRSLRVVSMLSVFSAALAMSLAVPFAHAADRPVEKVSVRAVASFGFDQAGLKTDDRSQLLTEVGQMKDVTWQTVRAVGHTDSIGPDAYNQKLSARRAEAVKAYLVGQGLSPDMIRSEGRGSQEPRASNDTAGGRAKNRRTEVEFQGVRVSAR